MKKRKHNSALRLVSFAALLGITFMLVFSGVQLTEVPFMVGQAVKIAVTKATSSSVTCSETDSGYELGKKGITKLRKNSAISEQKEDYCVSENELLEYYCVDSTITEESYECGCADGACYAYKKAEYETQIISPTTASIPKTQTAKKSSTVTKATPVSIITAVGCIDSDKGKTYDEQGTANDGTDQETDVCRTNGKLVEYYCDENDELQEEEVTCASGEVCSSGACVETGSCTDTESTFNMYSAGTVVGVWSTTAVSGVWTDKCDENTGRVWEYYCTDTGYAYYNMKDCPSGYACSEGKCIDACRDTDEAGTNKGTDYYTKGTTTGYWQSTMAEGTWTDYCTSTGSLVEYTCASGYVYSSGKKCSDLGKTCSDGACV